MTTRSHPSLPCRPQDSWSLVHSRALLAKAETLIPGTTLSMMKRPEHFCPGSFPVFLARGRGALVEDADGNEYIDFICGLGANSLGHRHPELMVALGAALEQGLLHSLPHELEVLTAEALVCALPNAEMVRFFKTGADATSAAVRLARHLTGREHLLTVGYNGWHDHFMVDTPGIPAAVRELTTRLPLFRPEEEAKVLEAIEAKKDEAAALLLSVPYNRVLSRSFLLDVKKACESQGILLIFDEVVTGLRVAFGGIQEFFDVVPDMSCYSKALAGGMPLSAVTGRKELLEKMAELQVSTTFGGELLSLAAALCSIGEHRDGDVIPHIARLGRRLREGINRVAEEQESTLRLVGYDAIPFFLFDPSPERHALLMRNFQGKMAQRGVLLRRDVNFLCAAHTEEQIDFTVAAAAQVLREGLE